MKKSSFKNPQKFYQLVSASAIILILTFIGLIVIISLDKIDRALLALIAALITFLVIVFLERESPNVIFTFLFGSEDDNYQNFHSLLLFFSMMFVVQLSSEGGVFQYITFKLLKMTKGKPVLLMLVFCTLSFLITSILTDVLTVLLLLPLTITLCRILDINPSPYIITQSILMKQGGTVFMISSVPAIMVSSYLNASFNEFFIIIGSKVFIIFVFTLIIFNIIVKAQLKQPKQGLDILLEFDVWTLVPNKSLMIRSMITLFSIIACFVIVPQSVLSTDMVAFIGAIVFAIVSKIDADTIIKKIDYKLLLYLMGIFILSGGLEYVGFINIISNLVKNITSSNLLTTSIFTLWFCAIVSGFIDNIPVARLLIPVIGNLTTGMTRTQVLTAYSGLVYGIVWGDNLTPYGDTLIALQVAKENNAPFKMSEFFKIGFTTAILQMILMTIIYCLIIEPLFGVILLAVLLGAGILLYLIRKKFFPNGFIYRLKIKIDALKKKK